MKSAIWTKECNKLPSHKKEPAPCASAGGRAFICLTVIFSILISSLLTSCKKTPKKTISLFALDTYVTLTVEGKEAEKAISEGTAFISEMEGKLSRQREDSEISLLNASSKDEPVSLSEETYLLLKTVCELSEKTEGAFDPTIAPLMDLWGFGTDTPGVPEEEEISGTLSKVDYRKIHLLSGNRAYVDPDTSIDLGGAAKGYIGDLLMEKIRSFDVTRVILDLGGNVSVWDSSSEVAVGIASPLEASGLLCTYSSTKNETVSVITSGAYERFFEEGGVRYGHIMDTKTGRPVITDLLSATVISADGTKGDCFSTTLFALGSEKAKEFAAREGIDCILCMENGTLWVSSSLKGKVHAQDGWTIEYFA